MDGACRMHGGDEKCIQNIIWKARREETTHKSQHRWYDNNKMALRETYWKMQIGFVWFDIGTDGRFCGRGSVPSGSTKGR